MNFYIYRVNNCFFIVLIIRRVIYTIFYRPVVSFQIRKIRFPVSDILLCIIEVNPHIPFPVFIDYYRDAAIFSNACSKRTSITKCSHFCQTGYFRKAVYLVCIGTAFICNIIFVNINR